MDFVIGGGYYRLVRNKHFRERCFACTKWSFTYYAWKFLGNSEVEATEYPVDLHICVRCAANWLWRESLDAKTREEFKRWG